MYKFQIDISSITHARTHARTHACTHARTHAHTALCKNREKVTEQFWSKWPPSAKKGQIWSLRPCKMTFRAIQPNIFFDMWFMSPQRSSMPKKKKSYWSVSEIDSPPPPILTDRSTYWLKQLLGWILLFSNFRIAALKWLWNSRNKAILVLF